MINIEREDLFSFLHARFKNIYRLQRRFPISHHLKVFSQLNNFLGIIHSNRSFPIVDNKRQIKFQSNEQFVYISNLFMKLRASEQIWRKDYRNNYSINFENKFKFRFSTAGEIFFIIFWSFKCCVGSAWKYNYA